MSKHENEIFESYNNGWNDARIIVNQELKLLRDENILLTEKNYQLEKMVNDLGKIFF